MDTLRVALDSIMVVTPSPKSDMDEISQLVTAATALFAVIVSPLIQLIVTRYQTEKAFKMHLQQMENAVRIGELEHRKKFVSEKRLEWIEEFRSEVAEATSLMSFISVEIANGRPVENLPEKIQKMQVLTANISLRLNYNEVAHQEFNAAIQATTELMTDMQGNIARIGSAIGLMRKKALVILKEEWKKVKEFQ